MDFGLGAWVMENGKRRQPHCRRAVLESFAQGLWRSGWRQTSENFLRCLENAFRSFGGVTATVVIDNLKAGVIRADWYDPELNPKLEEFARHYNAIHSSDQAGDAPAQGQGGVSRQVCAEQRGQGADLRSLTAQNAYLADGKRAVSDTRIHGTTRRQVGKLFEEVERHALQRLPANLFPVFEETARTVRRDGYVEFKKAYSAAPPRPRQTARLGAAGNLAHCGFICASGADPRSHYAGRTRSSPIPPISTAANATSSRTRR